MRCFPALGLAADLLRSLHCQEAQAVAAQLPIAHQQLDALTRERNALFADAQRGLEMGEVLAVMSQRLEVSCSQVDADVGMTKLRARLPQSEQFSWSRCCPAASFGACLRVTGKAAPPWQASCYPVCGTGIPHSDCNLLCLMQT